MNKFKITNITNLWQFVRLCRKGASLCGASEHPPREGVSTLVTLIGLFTASVCHHMALQTTFSRGSIFTLIAFQKLLSIANSQIHPRQICFRQINVGFLKMINTTILLHYNQWLTFLRLSLFLDTKRVKCMVIHRTQKVKVWRTRVFDRWTQIS